MSTRAVVYFHHKDEKECGLNYTMKLYHHWDGYLEWLGEGLNAIFKAFKKTYESNNSGSQRDLFNMLGEEGGFEMTPYYHSDTEYIYHVYYEDKRELWEENGKKFDFRIYFQEDGDHEWVWDEPMKLFSDNGEVDKSLLN